MATRALSLVVVVVSLSLAACAGSTAPTPEAQRGPSPSWLVGTWEAAGWQVGSDTTQGQRNVTVTFASDGTWKSSLGDSGTAWTAGDQVVMDGVTNDGYKFRFNLNQRQGPAGREMWGVVLARSGAMQVGMKQLR
jgi:hypothetical protein